MISGTLSLDGRRFVGLHNSPTGEIGPDTIFVYHEKNDVVWAEYSGGAVLRGMLLGKRTSANTLEFVYHQINRTMTLMTGQNVTRLEILPDGRIQMYENWQWTNGDRSSGTSIVVELSSEQPIHSEQDASQP